MIKKMPNKLISVDPKKLPWEQEMPVHNRWHPDIPPVVTVEKDQVFRVECIDWYEQKMRCVLFLSLTIVVCCDQDWRPNKER